MEDWKLRIALHAGRAGVLILLCGASTMASAQWAWRDEHGRPVYSDQPPPSSVKPTEILRQPELTTTPSDSPDAATQSSSNPAPTQPAPSRTASTAPRPPTMAEREQELRKRMKERSEAEKKLADAEVNAARKAEDCERAHGYMKTLDEGMRLVRTNPDGSQALLDEGQRAAEAQRTRDIIQSRCN
jgi:type IV secretory pathway VirB10-like protein